LGSASLGRSTFRTRRTSLAIGTSRTHDSKKGLRTFLIIGLTNGRRIALPIEGVLELKKATKKVLENWELLGRGTSINWPDIDVALPINGIIEGVYGKSRWMSELGNGKGAGEEEAQAGR
jgi:Protein of unknown function (DUF2442)